MNLDKNGFPVQSSGDANDQLQRVGMIATAQVLDPANCPYPYMESAISKIGAFQPHHGVFIRTPGDSTDNVSADQLISVLCYSVLSYNVVQCMTMLGRMTLRLGFAQNYRDGLGGSNALQIPDFMAIRAMPLFTRVSKLLYPLTVLTDILLVALSISAVIYARQDPNNVDQNDTIMTLAVCNTVMPTPLSRLAIKLFSEFLPPNMGSVNNVSNVQGALNWYHRASSGGNPEIADMWAPIVAKMFR